MATLPIIRRLAKEDFQDAPAWLDNLLSPLNQFMQGVYTALSGDLELETNIRGQIKDLPFKTTANYASPGPAPTTGPAYFNPSPLAFPRTMKSNPRGIIVIRATQGTAPIMPPRINWVDVGGVITITQIEGLSAGQSYRLLLLVV